MYLGPDRLRSTLTDARLAESITAASSLLVSDFRYPITIASTSDLGALMTRSST